MLSGVEQKLYLEMLSAYVVRCIYLLTLFTYVSIRAKCVEPDQTEQKLYLEMLSAYVVCCIYLLTLLTNDSIEAKCVEPGQTASKGAV